MTRRVVDLWFPSRDASPAAFRRAGGLYLIGAVVLGVVLVALLVVSHQAGLIPLALLPVLIVWLIGIQLVLWGGFSGTGVCANWGRAAVTALVGYATLAAVSALVGALATLLLRAA